MFQLDNRYQSWAPLFIRLAAGFGFMAHGWAKISRGGIGFERLLTQAGVPFPHVGALLAPYIELLGGLAILVGAFVVIAAVPLIVTMLVAMFYVQMDFGFSSVKTVGLTAQGPVFGPPGYEINLLYIAALVALMFAGAGNFSVDSLLKKRRISVKR